MVLSGTVGVGKTSVGRAISYLLSQRQVPHALIDLDWFETFWTQRKDLEQNEETLHRNISAVWQNYRDAGAERLVFCRIVEANAVLDRLTDAVPGARPIVVWLAAPTDQVLARIRSREAEDPSWFMETSVQVAERVVPEDIADHVIHVGERTPTQIAEEALRLTGWGELR
nr:AAA family ATPase [Actinopolymorpha cephalotaxi]